MRIVRYHFVASEFSEDRYRLSEFNAEGKIGMQNPYFINCNEFPPYRPLRNLVGVVASVAQQIKARNTGLTR